MSLTIYETRLDDSTPLFPTDYVPPLPLVQEPIETFLFQYPDYASTIQ